MSTKHDDTIITEAIRQARDWQNRANELVTSEEHGFQEQMMRLLNRPKNKVILTKMMDQGFRSRNTRRVSNQIETLLNRHGLPDFSIKEKMLVHLFLGVGRHFPGISVPKMIGKIREESSRAIIKGEKEVFLSHLRKRNKEGVRMNINHLGEAVLGEEEASARLETYLNDLARPEVECISVKISTIYSQISTLAFEETVSTIMERLTLLYRAAMSNLFVRQDGSEVQKIVNLDMEEYRDIHITMEAFCRTLDREEFLPYEGGIVLQAYLPDTFQMQKELTEWAVRRVDAGGSPIRLRIVKGANMEMEQVEASIQNWPLAPYDNKLEVDANFKRMVDFGMRPENIRAVRLGIGSHNLFELAYALKVGERNNVRSAFCFEMLEGMADHVRRAIQESTGDMLLYAPVASKAQFINAIAYLIRRLDENTAEENYLRHSFSLKTDSGAWEFLKDQFVSAYDFREKAGTTPKRIQDRGAETFHEVMGPFYTGEFTNEPDTDWALAGNRKWAEEIRGRWRKGPGDSPMEIPLVVAGKEIFKKRDTNALMDPSQVHERILVARCAMGNTTDAEKAVKTAKADSSGWRAMSYKERHEVLSRAAMEIRRSRGDLIGAAAASTGKVFSEADVEVSEAVDFTEFYPLAARTFDRMENIRCRGKGVGLVISPWNFPIAIPCGGIAASLAAGNTVIFKPASSAALVGWVLCQCFWKAGVSKKTLQFLPCPGSEVGSALAVHPDIDYVILTGGTDTGLALLRERPDMALAAETGGKNATIVSAMSDRDQAIKNVIHSSFSNCGQKCSATSLLILEKEVYEDEGFKKHLVDATSSLHVGSAWDFRSRLGPLIQPPVDPLKKAFTEIEPGESWALKPEMREDNPYLWSPGIKWDVQPGSFAHMTEFFGPLLGVMRADDLDQALDFVNQTGYGLTSGIESLDEREHEKWKETVRAGNLYINHGTTGAVVLRQPFGGMGKSALGAGIKVGFFNYVVQFMDFEETGHPPAGPIELEGELLRLANEWRLKAVWGEFGEQNEALLKTARAIRSYIYHQEKEFSREKDYFHLRGQDNIIRYLPVGKVLVRIHPEDDLFEVLARIAAVRISGCSLFVSAPKDLENPVMDFLATHEGRTLCGNTTIQRQDDEDLIGMMDEMDRIRYAAPDRVPMGLFVEAAGTGYYIARNPVLMEGRLELLQYHREQSICDSFHRYGNLGDRAYFDSRSSQEKQ